MSHSPVGTLVYLLLCVTAASVAVLLLRLPVRRLFGPRIAYALWALVPLAVAGALLPVPASTPFSLPLPSDLPVKLANLPMARPGTSLAHERIDMTWWLVVCWLAGSGVLALVQWSQQRAFVRRLGLLRQADAGTWASEAAGVSPAVVGVFPPRIVVPCDFGERYTTREQALVLAHERMHLRRRDPLVNFGVAAIRSVLWFHPLVHLAIRYFRVDQELACDAAVLEFRPHDRPQYAHAILKTQLGSQAMAAGCCLGSPTVTSLKRRIIMLRTPTPTLRRRLLGASVVTLASLASAGFAWALQSPATPAPILSADSAMPAATPAVMDTITAAAVAAPMATLGVVDTIAAAVAAPVATPAVDAQHRYRVGVEDNMTRIPSDSIVNASPVESATDIVPTSVPGLSVQRVPPAPGAPARLRAYGASSPRDNDPIVMVDGVRASNINGVSPLDHLDPNRIKTIEVLKGPSAISRYGQDAENGVIVITTKQDGQP